MLHENYGLWVERQRRAQPKGGMCANRRDRLNDCSGLDFHSMKAIDTYPLGTGGVVNIVRCDSFTRVSGGMEAHE